MTCEVRTDIMEQDENTEERVVRRGGVFRSVLRGLFWPFGIVVRAYRGFWWVVGFRQPQETVPASPAVSSPARHSLTGRKRLHRVTRMLLSILPRWVQASLGYPVSSSIGCSLSPEIRVSPTKPCGKGSKRKQDDLEDEEEEEHQTWVEALSQELADEGPEEDPDYEPSTVETESEEYASHNSTESDLEVPGKGIVIEDVNTVCGPVIKPQTGDTGRGRKKDHGDGIPSETKILDLSGNKLRWVEQGDLLPYPRLEKLDLSDNMISVLEPNAFSSLQNLQSLSLRGNQLKLVPMGAFSRLSNLTSLDLSENKIVILLDFTFQDLKSLKNLEVGDNDLVYISNKAFLGLVGLKELTIERCNLTSVSSQSLSYLHNLMTLRLRYLSISALEDQNFRKLGSLRGLEIDHWPFLEYISPHSLQGLNLSWLSITNTNITSVPTSALRSLAHLTSLNLSYNPISVLESWALRDLVRLKELHLVSTNLAVVQPYALGGLRQIRLLNFSTNNLVTLEEGAFQSVNTLETLRLDGNPLACDCRLLWILQRRKTLNFEGASPVCMTPVEVQGRALNAFSDSALFDHFTCQKPKIRNRKLQQISAREGQVVSFICRAEGEPTPVIFWISPQRRRITTKSNGRLTVLPEGTLEIRYAQVMDSGTYICIASNAGGNDTYFATLTVSGLPLDAALMANRTYYAGDLNDTNLNDTRVFLKFTLDLKTILISTAMGCIMFLGVVLFCFILLFVWSRGRGQHKNNFSVEYSFRKVDGPAASGGQGGARKFNMKMI